MSARGSEDRAASQVELRVGKRYTLGKKVGSGSFGDIFLGHDMQTNQQVAIKLEKATTKHPQLIYEYRIYKNLVGTPGIPNAKWCGVEGDYNVMVMELLGPSLEDLFNYCGRKFSLKTVLMIAEQLITRIESIHAKGYIHRDIKPDNFLIGLGQTSTTLFTIDFGLSKRYIDQRTRGSSYLSFMLQPAVVFA